MLALHVALAWLLLQTDVIDRVLPTILPVSVVLLADPPPPAAPEAARPLPSPLAPRQAAPALPALAPPRLDSATAAASPAAAVAAETTWLAEAPAAAAAVASTASPAAPALPSPITATPAPAPTPLPTAAEPRLLPPGAVRYRVPPAIAVPLASRRLRESGTVWLRVRVDRQGLPVQIVVHQSSGFPRLDEQAVVAMQAARFTPQTENGLPIEWVVIAPLAYEVD